MLKDIFEKLAPPNLAMEKDPIGLQIGTWSRNVTKILVTLDVNEKVVDEAIALGAEMIYCHHAPLFKPLNQINLDSPTGRMIEKLIKHNISVYVAHTNLDIVNGGVNDALAEALELENLQVLYPTNHDSLKKLAVFVPVDYKDKVLNALSNAGAGWIGNYSHCSFQLQGNGTFMPREGTIPYIGEQNVIEEVEEIRIETIFQASIQKTVIEAMIDAHPYEEVAYDIYPLDNKGQKYGLGRTGYYKEPLTVEEFIEKVKQTLSITHLKIVPSKIEKIEKVAVCGGSGSKFIFNAYKEKVDAYITGDVSYHEGQWAVDNGVMVIDAGHHQTEHLVIAKVTKYLEDEIKQLNLNIQTIASTVNTNPFIIL
ncbi:Nif3-like dinuclear metal center hexameric protein [Desulfuribacillus alkaliarsenatis]|uniref:GTP cyclohydrolase 1 type 2 homolog n=1 Tax=Desulfuribacillus alkaliarsenatis TaxID=766136 RepID=A0A1E5G181_9FIRM|nr:Nif3-like dinuclear metal center hexameric protein [Desulfuribacillus alkaliarsenatis]OEF96208.1 Nif3-like dinuclear metal center hexameric protein [Desulfuribacillus alkaliarsenatis]